MTVPAMARSASLTVISNLRLPNSQFSILNFEFQNLN
jgi:hypothetical protein